MRGKTRRNDGISFATDSLRSARCWLDLSAHFRTGEIRCDKLHIVNVGLVRKLLAFPLDIVSKRGRGHADSH